MTSPVSTRTRRRATAIVQRTFQELDGQWDAEVAGRVLHHVNPLDEGIAKLASLAPLLVVDEFASNRIDAAAQDWYEAQHRLLARDRRRSVRASVLDDWREHHPGLHSDDTLLAALRAHTTSSRSTGSRTSTGGSRGPRAKRSSRASSTRARYEPIGYLWAGSGRRRGRPADPHPRPARERADVPRVAPHGGDGDGPRPRDREVRRRRPATARSRRARSCRDRRARRVRGRARQRRVQSAIENDQPMPTGGELVAAVVLVVAVFAALSCLSSRPPRARRRRAPRRSSR